MRFLALASALAFAAPIIAYPLPERSDFDDFEDDVEDDDTCAGPSSIHLPMPVPIKESSTINPPQASTSTSELASSLTSALASTLTTASSSDIVPSSSSHHGHFTDPLTIVPFPTAQSSDPATTSLPVSTASGPAPSDPTTSDPASSNPPTASATTATSASATSQPTTASNPPAAPSGILRGVNVGNWLVIEPWMDDGSLIKGKFKNAPDQWTFDGLDTDGSAIKAHWDSWFTEADVQKIKSFGFNALRIPIGYWAIDNSGTPYHKGAADYMDKAIGWARNAGMKVLVDCHGSPGSQNGQMHSGHQGNVVWQQDENLQKSTEILQKMVQKWGTKENADVVFGIEIVNEPTANSPNDFSVSQSWAASAYDAMQKTIAANGLNKDIQIITHDSFEGPTKFISVAAKVHSPITRTTFGVDQHDYQLYTDSDNSLDQPAHIKKACGWSQDLATTKARMPVYVGEWSALTNICVDSNGKTSPGPGKTPGACTSSSPQQWNKQVVEQVRRYVEAQLDTYEANADGHFIWAYNAPGGWGLSNLIDVGAFPQPIDARKYPGQCS